MVSVISARKASLRNKEGKIVFQSPRKQSRKFAVLFLIAVLIVVGGILLEGLLVNLPGSSKSEFATERIGVIHVHTLASDGGGTVPEVMEAAEKANLSFVAITDHNVAMTANDLAADPPDLPIIAGEEFSTPSGHFLALGLPASWDQPKTKNARALLDAAHAAGAFTVLAHPFHPRTPWTDWKTSAFDGLEVWNEDSAWRQRNVLGLLDALLLYPVNEQLAMVRLASTPDTTFAKWDELLEQRPVAGICGADAHDKIRLGFGHSWRFPAYTASLNVAREHVLLDANAGQGDPSHATSTELLDALRHGHSFCALDGLYPASGFSFRVTSGGRSGGPGDSLSWTGAGHVQISVPSGASLPLIKLFRDGKEITEEQSWNVDTPIAGPGLYRTEVYLRQPGVSGWRMWTLWAFTNPVYLTPH